MGAATDILAHWAALSRGIVVFRDYTCLVWQAEDGNDVIKWVNTFDTPKSEHAAQHGGLFHAVVYTVRTGFVIYETDH